MNRERTKIQDEANDLDMEMHRLAGRIERFADMVASMPKRHRSILSTAGNLRFGRSDVREFMHAADVEETK